MNTARRDVETQDSRLSPENVPESPENVSELSDELENENQQEIPVQDCLDLSKKNKILIAENRGLVDENERLKENKRLKSSLPTANSPQPGRGFSNILSNTVNGSGLPVNGASSPKNFSDAQMKEINRLKRTSSERTSRRGGRFRSSKRKSSKRKSSKKSKSSRKRR